MGQYVVYTGYWYELLGDSDSDTVDDATTEACCAAMEDAIRDALDAAHAHASYHVIRPNESWPAQFPPTWDEDLNEALRIGYEDGMQAVRVVWDAYHPSSPATPSATTEHDVAYGIGRVPADVDPAAEALAQIEAAQMMAARITDSSESITCPNCGMPTRRALLMSASRGTACPACYDDLSE